MRTDIVQTTPPNRMIFRVAQHKYEVMVTRDPLWHDGVESAGLICADRRQIFIAVGSGYTRLEILLHELAHAWVFATGEPQDIEGWCDLVATINATAMRDLNRQGGERALKALEPIRVRIAVDERQKKAVRAVAKAK